MIGGKLPELVTAANNVTANRTMSDVTGNKDDANLSGPGMDSLYGIAGFMAYYHVHSPSKIYPELADPIVITAGAGAWNLGSLVEIIDNTVKTEAFDIHFLNLGALSASDDYELRLYSGESGLEVLWGACSFSRDTNQMRAAFVPIQGAPIPKNTRISAALASGSGSNNVAAKIYTHEYPA
jgi:hypothetical protein